jgi:[acyl-carrier-protein] S-malonyltransferase
MKAFIFPGQGSQFPGMGKELNNFSEGKKMFNLANEILNFSISKTMFEGSESELKQTKITQPSIFLHSVILARLLDTKFNPDFVAGHSLGEISAITASGGISFEDGLRLVYKRAIAMQKACENNKSTMSAVLGLNEKIVEETCRNIKDIVVPANYNCPGQIVISGSTNGIKLATNQLLKKGARKVIELQVSGAFHSPLMEEAKNELINQIEKTKFSKPICPVYQNFNAKSTSDPHLIKKNLINQLTKPVLWHQIILNLIEQKVSEFIEVGPGRTLQGLIKKINREITTKSAEI